MKPVKLDKDAVKAAILNSESESTPVITIFKMVYPGWDEIKSVQGYPQCNKATWKMICEWFMELTTRLNLARPHDKKIMPGGSWMNYGFSCSDAAICEALKDWQVLPAPVVMAEVTETECVGAI